MPFDAISCRTCRWGLQRETPSYEFTPAAGQFSGAEHPMQTLLRRQSLTGIGPVRIGPSWAYAYWQYMYDEEEDGQHTSQRWMIRLSIDDFERLNLPPD